MDLFLLLLLLLLWGVGSSTWPLCQAECLYSQGLYWYKQYQRSRHQSAQIDTGSLYPPPPPPSTKAELPEEEEEEEEEAVEGNI